MPPILSYLTIGQRQYSFYNSIEAELSYQEKTQYYCSLPHLGLLRVSGDKAGELLQGQISCDVDKVAMTQSLRGVYCNIKGRILSLFDIILLENNDYGLIMPQDLLARTQKILSRYAMLSRVKVTIDDNFSFKGLIKLDTSVDNQYIGKVVHDDDSIIITLNSQQRLVISRVNQETNDNKGSLFWHYISLKNNRFNLYPATQLEFLPHRLDLHLNNVLDFEKGCYLGQEIIARTHYRAKLKHGLYRYQTQNHPGLTPGLELQDEHNNTAQLVDLCPLNQETTLLVLSLNKNHGKYLSLYDIRLTLD